MADSGDTPVSTEGAKWAATRAVEAAYDPVRSDEENVKAAMEISRPDVLAEIAHLGLTESISSLSDGAQRLLRVVGVLHDEDTKMSIDDVARATGMSNAAVTRSLDEIARTCRLPSVYLNGAVWDYTGGDA
jgi:aminopeptidase-like protein